MRRDIEKWRGLKYIRQTCHTSCHGVNISMLDAANDTSYYITFLFTSTGYKLSPNQTYSNKRHSVQGIQRFVHKLKRQKTSANQKSHAWQFMLSLLCRIFIIIPNTVDTYLRAIEVSSKVAGILCHVFGGHYTQPGF